jgi:hypothetical protein
MSLTVCGADEPADPKELFAPLAGPLPPEPLPVEPCGLVFAACVVFGAADLPDRDGLSCAPALQPANAPTNPNPSRTAENCVPCFFMYPSVDADAHFGARKRRGPGKASDCMQPKARLGRCLSTIQERALSGARALARTY